MLLRLPGFTGVFEEAEQERDVLDANSFDDSLRPLPPESFGGQWQLLRTGSKVDGIHVNIKPCAQPLARFHCDNVKFPQVCFL